MVQLAEVCGSNPVIGKIYIEHCLLSTVLKRKRGREWLMENNGSSIVEHASIIQMLTTTLGNALPN